MTPEEKKQFIFDLIQSTTETIVSNIDKMPDEWDGVEIRQYIADKFSEVAWKGLHGKRRKEYKVEHRLLNVSKFCSKQCRFDNDSDVFKGSNNPNYKRGDAPERQCLYTSRKWTEIRKNVHEREDFKCKRCDHSKDVNNDSLVVHHIIPFKNESTRLKLDNLVLLCIKCHRFVHSSNNVNNEYSHEHLHDLKSEQLSLTSQ